MTIETINTRIENTQKKLDKAYNKLKRIEKAAESNYENNNPYLYDEYDMRSTKRDIADLEASLSKYKAMLSEEQSKADSRNVPVLVEFLNNWKDMAKKWYNNRRTCEERVTLKKKKDKAYKAYYDYDHKRWSEISKLRDQVAEEIGAKTSYADEVDEDPRVIKLEKDSEKHSQLLAKKMKDTSDIYQSEFTDIEEMEETAYSSVISTRYEKMKIEAKANKKKYEPWKNPVTLTNKEKNAAWDAYLEKILDKEWNRKYDRLIEDVIRITGTIDDASGLRVNEKGDLDGYIVGKKGKARINTFGAGGYNIQCFHYRTKITKMK